MNSTALKAHALQLRQEEMKARTILGSQDTDEQLARSISSPEILQPHFETNKPRDLAFQRHLTLKEIAEQWAISETTALRLFCDEPGVIRLGNLKSRKRTKITLRIPEDIVRRVHASISR